MKEHGISFSPEMVKAIMEGKKFQTRRITPRTIEVGDRIWVKEALKPDNNEIPPCVSYALDGAPATDTTCLVPWNWKRDTLPAMYMPKWAARTWLEVTEVRTELLQDITDEDAIAEGIEPHPVMQGFPSRTGHINIIKKDSVYGVHSTLKSCYAHLWNHLHRDVPYEVNPRVQVISFKKIERK
jgi:hypothetical protein